MDYAWIWLYLFTRVDLVCGVAFIAAVVSSGVSAWALFLGALEDRRLKNFGQKIIYRIFVPAFAVVLILPTKNDLALIIGGHYVVRAATSETARDVTDTGRKLLELINRGLTKGDIL